MTKINEQIEEIKRVKGVIKKTKSIYAKWDYTKYLNKLIEDLRLYCLYRNYDFKEIIKTC
jgi:hypothetical protein